MLDLSKLSPAHQNLFSQLKSIGYPNEQAFANAMLWQARAEAGISRWNLENPASPMSMEDWLRRYPLTITSSIPQGQPSRTLHQFAGPQAQSAASSSLAAALGLEREGATPDAILAGTGWFRGLDHQWRFEIDDSQARFRGYDYEKDEAETTSSAPELYQTWMDEAADAPRGVSLTQALDHPKLFAAYPLLQFVRLKIASRRHEGASMHEDSLMGGFVIEIGDPYSYPAGEALKSVMHEVQHVIQVVEGFALGGNADDLGLPTGDQLGLAINDEYRRRAEEIEASEAYQQLVDQAFSLLPPEDWIHPRSGVRDERWARSRAIDSVYESSGLEALEAERLARIDRALTHVGAFGQGLDSRFAGYRHLAGEAEARNTAARVAMSESQRRENAPWATLDIDPRDALVRLGENRRAAQQDEPLRAGGADLPLIEELAAFQRLSDEQQFDEYERREVLFDRLADLYQSAPWFQGVFLPLAHGWVGVTGSAKEAGLWQVSFFDAQMMPMSDTGSKGLNEALHEAFGEARFDLVLGFAESAGEQPADRSLQRSRVREADGSLLKVFHGTVEVKTIPGDSVPGDPAAIEELKAMATRFGIADYQSVRQVLERLGRTGQRGRLGDTDEDAARAEVLSEKARWHVEPSRNAIGFDAFHMPSGDMELGAHFGSRDQALMFGEPFEFYLDLRNPVRLPDLGNWHYSKVIVALRAAGVGVSPDEEGKVERARDHNEALRTLMLSKGYDGVIYRNEAEGVGDSYIALKPEAIFPADQVVQPELQSTRTPAFRDWFRASAATVDGAPGGDPLILYHGTDADIEVFEGREVTAWVSEDPVLASGYAASLRSGLDEDESAPNVVPVFASVQNPLVLDFDMNDPVKVLGQTLTRVGLLDRLRLIYDNVESVWEVVNSSDFMRAINKLGYDGVRVRERGVWTWGVDGQSQLKSIFNSGSFSPESPLILNQSAVVAASGFARWFEGSPVATPDGRPQVMYHGTKTPEGLTVFVPGGRGDAVQSGDLLGVASYFTSDRDEANIYAGEAGAVLPVYLSGMLLNLEAPILPADEAERLSAFADRVLLPADRARFSSLRKARFFSEAEIEEAKAFYEAERARWKTLDGVMERSKPEVDKQGELFLVRYTDFESPVQIRTSDDAEALFRSVGWGNLPALGYDGVMLTNSEGRRWVAMHRPDGNVKSAIGNNGQFNRFSPRILDQSAYHGSVAEFDQFDPAVRSGVGRSYGHGIYLTADRGIADRYRQAMARQRGWVGPVAAEIAARFAEDYPDVLRVEGCSASMLAQARGTLVRLVEAYADPAFLAWADELAPGGRVYTAEIPEPYELLNWDLPVGEQPAAIRELLYARSLHTVPLQPGFDLRGEFDRDGEPTGADIYLYLEQAYGSAEKASAVLGSLGIKGLTYRNIGFRSRDFVVFAPDDARIVERGTDSTAFHDWFAGSTLTEDGQPGGVPMVFYHGTRPGVDFEVFQRGSAHDGIYFTPDPDYADGFTSNLFDVDPGRVGGAGLAGQIMPVYLRVERPYVVEAAEDSPEWESFVYRGLDCSVLAAQGYDAAVLKVVGTGEIDQVIVFDSLQVKSAIGNTGAFDPRSPSILNQASVPDRDEWLGNSALTENGEPGGAPVVLYHGTSADFVEFKPSAHGEYGPGVYLSFRESSARMWGSIAGGRGGEVTVVPVHVRMENPYRISKLDLQEMALEEDEDGEPIGMLEVHRRLRAKGYDGIIGVGLTDSDVQVVAFDGDQVRRIQDVERVAEAGAKPAGDELALVMAPEFADWFKGSMVADGDRPKKVYHGSRPGPDSAAIEVFDRLYLVNQGRRAPGQDNVGLWFSETLGRDGVDKYSGGDRVYNGAVYPVYLSIKKPWAVSFYGMRRVANRLLGRERGARLDGEAVDALRAWMKENDIDGIQLLHDPRDGDEFAAQQVWVALEPEQIRTAITADVRYVPVSQLGRAPVQALDAFIDRALESPAFCDWFSASKATMDGTSGTRPLVLFHGTQADFDVFDPARQGESVSSGDVGFFFTNYAKEASLYATADWWREDPQPNVMPVFLSLQNPKELTCDPFEGPGIWYDNHGQDETRKALEEGYDGLIVRSTQPSMVMPNGEQIAMYVAFEPTQIKSALSNVGAFDRNDPRILFQSAAPTVWVNPFQMEAWTQKAGLSPAAVEAIAKIGVGQRGKPEHLMVEAQMIMGGGVLQHAIEHVGDLTDRMGPRHGLEWGYEEAVDKATTCLRKLRSTYGFAREHAENLASNARFRGVSVERHAVEVNEALERYAAAHAELEAPTRIHAIARDAAVQLGRQDFNGAAEKLEALLEAIPTFEAYISELSGENDPSVGVSASPEVSKDWFADSKVVDAVGKPLLVYHGTAAEFDEFSPSEGGIFFAVSRKVAEFYALEQAGNATGHVVSAYLSISNPLVMTWREYLDGVTREGVNHYLLGNDGLTELGYDGLKLVEPESDDLAIASETYVAFRPDQVSVARDARRAAPETPRVLAQSAFQGRAPRVLLLEPAAVDVEFDFSLPADGNVIREYAVAGASVVLSVHSDGEVSLSSLRVPVAKRGRGAARRAMEALLQHADEAGVAIKLGASALDRRTRTDKLVAFYQSLGFELTGSKINALGEPEMLRRPGGAVVREENLLRWSDGSKVVDANGKLLIVYHGTGADIVQFNADGRGKTSGAGVFFSSSPVIAATYATGESPNVVPAYLNLKSPIVVDAGGANWARLGRKVKVSLPAVEVSDQSDEDLLAELEGREPRKGVTKKIKAKTTTLGKLFGGELVYDDDFASTDDLARWARNQGYDGAIIKNVMDHGPSGRFATDEKVSDIYVAFSAEQIKSAIGNNGEFSPATPNILAQSPVPAASVKSASLSDVDELTPHEQEDLVTALLEGRSESFAAATAGENYSEETVRQELFGLQDPLMVRRLTLPLEAVSAVGRSFSGSVAAAYAGLSSKAPAILVKRDGDDWALVEGGHRYQAAVIRGDAFIEVVDVTEFLRMDWKSYLVGESLPGMPLKSLVDGTEFDPSNPSILAQSPVPADLGGRWPMHGLPVRDRAEDEAFRDWFGASRATHDLQPGSKPLVVYHGTGADFDEFSDEFIGTANDEGFAGRGFYFMDDPDWASGYAELAGENGGQASVIPVHLYMGNPLVIRDYAELPLPSVWPRSRQDSAAIVAALRERGHDGVIVLGRLGKPSEFLVFEAAQVKSAIGNRGGWDRLSRKILDQAPAAAAGEMVGVLDAQLRSVRAWMGNSVITQDGSAGGEPLVVYHGSHVSGIAEFQGGRTAYGIFFTPDPQTAGYYAVGDDAQVYEAFLKVESLADFDDSDVFERVMREAVDFTQTRDAEDVRAFAARLYREGFGKSDPVTRFFVEQDGFSDVDGVEYTIEDLLSDNRIDSSEIDDLVDEIASEKVSAAYAEAAPAKSEELEAAREAYGTQQFYMEYQDDFMRAARVLGYDGVVFSDPSSTGSSVSYVVFDASQIMLAPESVRDVHLDQAAWHGTPHQFESFELEKVGTSEGAAAFGWGVYFASHREIALWYSGALGISGATVPQLFTIRGEPTQRGTAEQKAADLVSGVGLSKAKKMAREWVRDAYATPAVGGERGPEYYESVLEVLDGLKSSRDVRRAPGNLLKVDIPDVDQLLDWDAPLSAQPMVVLRAIAILSAQYDLPSAASGGLWYKALAAAAGSDKQASFCLKAEGVPGISYMDGASRGATGGSRNFVICDESLVRILGRERVDVLNQFAGEKAAGADFLALKLARKLVRQGRPEADVLSETGWFRGVDGQWRFELDASQAALRPEMVALLREGDDPVDVVRVAAHVSGDGLWTFSMVANSGVSRLVQRVPEPVVSLILPDEVVTAVKNGRGQAVELSVGDQFLPAVAVDASYRFAGVESLPLPIVLDYPALFEAYPALRGGAMALIEGVRSMTSGEGDILVGRDLHLSRFLPVALHEIQHVIQTLEGFAPGGAPEMAFSSPAINPLATRGGLRAARAILGDKLAEMARPSTLEEYARDAWQIPAGQAVPDDVQAAYAEYVEGVARAASSGAFSRPAQQAAAREWYRRLAGEMEARLVERRWRLSAEERRALLPGDGFDVDPKDAIVLRYSASSACVADSVAMASRLGALIDDYLRVDTGLSPWFKQSVVDSASWSKGECEKVSVDLVAWLREQGCDAQVIFAQGLRAGLDAGAAADWEQFRDRGGRAEHFWHAAVLCEGVVADLSGAQFGSRYAGVRLLTAEDFHAEWDSVRVSREGRSVDLRRLASGAITSPQHVPDAQFSVEVGGLARVHGLISRGALPGSALREVIASLQVEGLAAEADDLRMLGEGSLDAFGWSRRESCPGCIISLTSLVSECGGVLDSFAQELAQWNPARYGLPVTRGGMAVSDLVRGMLARLQNVHGTDRDTALGMVIESFQDAGVLAIDVQVAGRRVRVDLDFAADSFKQALAVEEAPRAQIALGENLSFDIRLLAMGDSSSFAHETGHAFLEILRDQSRLTTAKDSQIRADWQAVVTWLNLQSLRDDQGIPVEAHERFARGFELYLRRGVAPSVEMEGVFKLLADLLRQLYETIRSLFVTLPADVEEVFARMLSDGPPSSAEVPVDANCENRNAMEM